MSHPPSSSLFSVIIFSLRALEDILCIQVGGYNLNHLRYADDTVVIAKNEIDLQQMLDTVIKESVNKVLSDKKPKTNHGHRKEKLLSIQHNSTRHYPKASSNI